LRRRPEEVVAASPARPLGAFFRSYDEAWESFLAREEPLEWLFGDFPEDESFVADVWLIEPSPNIKKAAARLQRHLDRFPWLAPVPEHFLHVSLGEAAVLEQALNRWAGSGSFEIRYERVNCFHSAVVVEAHSPRLHDLVEGTTLDPRTFLPHLTIAVTREEHEPDDLRSVLIPLRDLELGRATATEATRARVPAARSTVLCPWEVVEKVRL
jgi:2'-5' RNA ligase